MKNSLVILILFIFTIFSLSAQVKKTDANIFGHVVYRGEHLVGVHVQLKGTQIGTVTDRTGHFFLYDLPIGKQTIVASGVGYKTQEIEVDIVANTSIEVNFELEADVVTVKEVVITGSRMEQDKKESPVVVSVIGSKLIESTNSMTITDVLGFQSGLRVDKKCQGCGFKQVRINGLEGPYSQILIDGRPIFSALAGVYGLEHIPVSMIDRIEVVKGAGSATYGSNAIGGTINIITKDPLYNSYQIGHNISAINNNTFDNNSFFNSTVLSNGNNGGLSIFGNIRNRQDYDHNDDGFTEITRLKVNSFGFKAFQRFGRQSKITVEYHTVNDFRRGGDQLNLVPHHTEITEQAAHLINSGSVVYEYLMKENKGRINVFSSFRHIQRDTYYGSGQDPNAYGTSLDQVSFTGFEYLRFFDKGFLPKSLMFGSDFKWNSVDDIQLAYNRNIKQITENVGVFSQAQWKFGRVTLLGGIRADHHNLMDNIVISPRINVLYGISEFVQFRGGFSTGFRAPQAFDVDFHIAAVGGEVQLIELDPDLKPETSQSYTLSFDWTPSFAKNKINFIAEGFYTSLYDVFVLEDGGTDIDGNMIMVRTNADAAIVTGANLELKFIAHADLDVQLGFTMQKSEYANPIHWSEDENAETTLQMLRTPNNYGFAGINWRVNKNITFSLNGIYTGSMLVPRYAGFVINDVLVETEPFYDINFRVAKLIKLPGHVNLEIACGVKNMFNSYQREFDKGSNRDAGFVYGPLSPRHLFLSVKFGNIM